MKNSEIHFGLENSDLRDFLSISIIKNYQQSIDNIKPYNEGLDVNEWAIKNCENEIIYYTQKLKLLKERQSITTLIKMQGWKDFDVSDETVKDLKYNLAMNFIGTELEYNNLMSILKI